MLVLCSFLLVEEEGVFGLDVGHLIIQSKEIMLEILQLKQFLLQ
jgi:hypothetical protein